MGKHYNFQHACAHTGIGPVIRTSINFTTLSATDDASPDLRPSLLPTTAFESILLSLPIQCPFCAETNSYQNIPSGSGVLVILEPSPPLPISPITSASSISTSFSSITPNPFPYSWRVLRACRPDEISTPDWYLARGPTGQFRQMAWIPKPCGVLSVGRLEEERRNGEVVRGPRTMVDCSWRQRWDEGEVVRTRLPGMLGRLNVGLMDGVLQGHRVDEEIAGPGF